MLILLTCHYFNSDTLEPITNETTQLDLSELTLRSIKGKEDNIFHTLNLLVM